MARAPTILALFGLALSALGCPARGAEPEGLGQTRAEPAVPSARADRGVAASPVEHRAEAHGPRITLASVDGAEVGSALRTAEDRWRLEDGAGDKIGSARVEPDRVKVKDARRSPRAKVKLREQGLKLLDGEEHTLLKGKLKGPDHLVVETEHGARRGEVRGMTGTLEGRPVEVRAAKRGLEVRVDGAPAFRVEGPVGPGAAALAAFPGLDLHHRLALLIFFHAVTPNTP